MSKRQDNREFLQSIPPADVKYIINGYLASEASQADADTYIKVYELHCGENKSIAEIAKSLKVSTANIEQKIQKIIDLIKRDPIMVDKLPPDTDIFQIPLQSLFLSTRTYQCLRDADIITVGDIVRRGENDLRRIKNFGGKSLNEIKTVLWHLMSRFQSKPRLQEDIEKLKARSVELSGKSGEWSQDDHKHLVQVLGELEGKVTETKSLIELVLKSITRRGHHVQEGFVIPFAVWERLWSWSDRERHPEKTILAVMDNFDKTHIFPK